MKSLRSLALLIAVGTISLFPVLAHGQQEVDPDHFDQAPAKVATQKAHSAHMSASSHRQQSGHVKLASKYGSKHHRHARASA